MPHTKHTGSSHVCRIARADPQVAYVGIRGGQSEHVKEFIIRKPYLQLASREAFRMVVRFYSFCYRLDPNAELDETFAMYIRNPRYVLGFCLFFLSHERCYATIMKYKVHLVRVHSFLCAAKVIEDP